MIRRLTIVLIAAWTAGCADYPPAPVEDRSSAPVADVSAAPPVEAKPGYYVVKKGDTLYSIALDHGQGYRDVAAWNNLEDPNRIQVGQQLRVVAPEGPAAVAVAQPIAGPGQIEVRPIDASPAPAAPAAPTRPAAAVAVAGGDVLKREPKGGKVAYSEQALAAMQRPEIQAPPLAAPRPAETRPQDKPAEKPAAIAPGTDSVDWIWPAGGKVVSGFVEGTNKGVDLGGRTGEPVFAAGAGKVVYVGTGIRGYGKMVIIKHNAAFLSVYAHNSQILVKEDQMVGKGQKIAEIGSTDSDQPMLHFEIRHQNKPVDPLKYLPAR